MAAAASVFAAEPTQTSEKTPAERTNIKRACLGQLQFGSTDGLHTRPNGRIVARLRECSGDQVRSRRSLLCG